MTISQRMFDILKQKRLSQAELAKKLGISPSTISTWKKEGTDPPTKNLLDIAEFLGISVNELLGDKSPMGDILLNTEHQFENPFRNEAVWIAYTSMKDIQKLRVQLYILETAKGDNIEEQQ